MSQLTWTKGLFRTWVVLSGAWIIFSASVMANEIVDPNYAGHYIIADEARIFALNKYSAAAGELDQAKSEAKVHAYAVQGIPGTTVFVSASLSKQESDKRLVRAISEAGMLRAETIAQSRMKALQTLTILALLPPLVFLAAGAALTWALRGFTAS